MEKASPKKSNILAEHFFRHEYAKMVAVISRYFSSSNVNLAEDIVQDTLLDAVELWVYHGIPEHPTAWLYTVAKNKALNIVKREKYRYQYEKEIKAVHSAQSLDLPVEKLFSEQKIADDQLHMMFACCHPSISQESQIAIILKTLCGLSITEIAKAYVTTNETINKRLVRARKTMRKNNIQFGSLTQKDLECRLDVVLQTIYLLFNEGYNASKGSKLIRYELCLEAVRLAEFIIRTDLVKNKSRVHALLALMLFNTSRFEARQDEAGNIIEMARQNRSLWNQLLINKGIWHLESMKERQEISLYHVLATISAYHCTAVHYESTNWSGILSLYNVLITFDTSPVVMLNRAIAMSKVHGNRQALAELVRLEATKALENYYLFYSTFAELYIEQQQYEKARKYIVKAIQCTEQDSEVRLLTSKLERCNKKL